MELRVEFFYDDINSYGERGRDKVIRAVDKAMGGATWEADGDGWVVRR